jgi:hypothetical protein
MSHRTIRILVIDPVGSDYLRIKGLLDLCGVFQYEVDHAVGPEMAEYADAGRRYDCYFIDVHCALRGKAGILPTKGRHRGAFPVVFLCDEKEASLGLAAVPNCVPREQLTLATLLLSVSSALRNTSRRTRRSEQISLPVFLSQKKDAVIV